MFTCKLEGLFHSVSSGKKIALGQSVKYLRKRPIIVVITISSLVTVSLRRFIVECLTL